MPLCKKCRHGRGLAGHARQKAWRRCGCAWLADVYIEGRRRYVPLGSEEAHARIAYAQLVADRESGRLGVHLTAAAGAFSAVAERWLATLAVEGLKPSTIETYAGAVKRLVDWFGTVHVARIRIHDVADFRAAFAQVASRQYQSNVATVLRQVLGHAVSEGLLEAVPEPPAPRRRRMPAPADTRMTFAECERTIAALAPKWRPMGELILLTGLRRGEALALTWADVDLATGVLRVDESYGRHGVGSPKNRTSIRVLGLSPRAAELLSGLPRIGERVFPACHPGGAQMAIRSALHRAGTRAPRRGWHSLRHAHAALLDAAQVPIRDAAARLGHGANVARTFSYGWSAEVADPSRIDEARTRHAAPGG